MNKQDVIQKLITHCKELSKLNDLQKQHTQGLQDMAKMVREGLKETPEFKTLEQRYSQPTVICFGDVVNDIVRTVKYL